MCLFVRRTTVYAKCCVYVFVCVDEPLCDDVLSLCDCLKAIKLCLTEEIAYCFEQDMFHTQSPIEVANSIVSNLLAETG